MRSLTLSQCRDLRMGVICEDLGALTTEWCAELYYYRVPRWRIGERPLDIGVSCEISGLRPDE